MSSLLSTVRKGRWFVPDAVMDTPGGLIALKRFFHAAAFAANSPDYILVNAQSVFDDMLTPDRQRWSPEAADYFGVHVPITPPHPRMWIEAHTGGQRLACILNRFRYSDDEWVGNAGTELVDEIRSDNPHWVVTCLTLLEHGGSASFGAQHMIWLDAKGCFIRSLRLCGERGETEEGRKINTAVFRLHTAFIVHTLARFNCANVQLKAVDGQQRNTRHAGNGAPRGTIWRTIVVRDLRNQRPPHKNKSAGVELRSHWVRGHYADYTAGAGLFGNASLRGVFWMPEHRRGNSDAGEVIADYRLAASSQGERR